MKGLARTTVVALTFAVLSGPLARAAATVTQDAFVEPIGYGAAASPPPDASPAPDRCAGGFVAPDTTSYANPIDGVMAVSKATQAYLKACGPQDQEGVARALDAYAAAVAAVAPRLPPQWTTFAGIVSDAAGRARNAPSRRAAAAVLRGAEAQVRKTIALIRADDPDVLRRQTRGGLVVVQTLDVAVASLERPQGL